MRYSDLIVEYRANAEMWIDPRGRVYYDGEFPPGETADSRIKQRWIWVKSNPDGSLSARHDYATPHAYARLRRLLQQHEAETGLVPDPEESRLKNALRRQIRQDRGEI